MVFAAFDDLDMHMLGEAEMMRHLAAHRVTCLPSSE
jgi:hypothetical protein